MITSQRSTLSSFVRNRQASTCFAPQAGSTSRNRKQEGTGMTPAEMPHLRTVVAFETDPDFRFPAVRRERAWHSAQHEHTPTKTTTTTK